MKKSLFAIIVFLLSAVLLFCFTACDKNSGDKDQTNKNNTSGDIGQLIDFSNFVTYELNEEGTYDAYIEDENPYFFQKLLKIVKNIDITIPEGVESIEELPEDTTDIIYNAFSDYIEAIVGDELTEINETLYKYPKLTVTIDESYQGKKVTSVSSLESHWFAGLIEEIKLPKTIAYINEDFCCAGFYSLKKIIIDSENPIYHVYNDVFIFKDFTEEWQADKKIVALSHVPANQSIIPNEENSIFIYSNAIYFNLNDTITIAEGYSDICFSAFYHCNLSTINLPSSIVYIDAGAFTGCSSLTTINYSGTMEEWYDVVTNSEWNPATLYTVHCSDGDIIIE